MPQEAISLSELRSILQGQEATVLLHPIYEVESRQPRFHEVLLRLLDHRGDEILPKFFIPTAVQHGMMPWLDMLTLDVLSSQLNILAKEPPTPVCVNISRHSLLHVPYVDKLAGAAWQPMLKSIMFELKTGDITRDISALKNLISLKSGGTTLCVDYQNGGIKAVEFAMNLGFDYLKIDAVNASLKYNDAELANVQAACREAKQAGLKIIFERVETPGDYRAALKYGPEYVQGYLFGKPARTFTVKPFSASSL